MSTEKIVYLDITSWAGLSLGAIHYYGTLWGHKNGDMEKVELTRFLSARAAAKLTKLHGTDWVYRAGRPYHGFDTRDEIIELAKRTYRDHFPAANILILGKIVVADPQPVLDGPPDFTNKVNTWVKEAESIGWYDGGHEQRMDRISDAYNELVRKFR